MAIDISEVLDFLPCETPQAWVDAALEHPEELLIDHANCEKKAAGTALNLMFRYVDKLDLLNKMSRLAREELRHFEQVLAIMKKRGVEYRHVSSSRYANGLRELARSSDPGKLIDILICGALIEARSCERFAKIAPHLDDELRDFYLSLLKSESRHFKDYLTLAAAYAGEPIDERVAVFRQREQELIESADTAFRFHSGPPCAA
ncbi:MULTISPECIES: tRNA-(ms[2]io[6]A)-hydroxylase [Spongiibacter]|uniref:tRNA-(ms[2]io[6]A)-hydroxylase n=1 Tax=Spongiibacter TaxID=630749 RepID=UPI0003B70478|nr:MULTISPECIES: tRNA-(ms[2]io[6]A)-hydroxylase [Spongiibacter]MBO6754219.1 tRNA-(ms[2]io[6]A)-hydroxylase [Spongiibacter sp.]|tara:strand:- start:46426 stop:47037 length:612 start_codon:yes stop_codon:yes gene_type:complete